MSKRSHTVSTQCNICKLDHPPSADRKVQPVRTAKSKGSSISQNFTEWIECSVCKSWSHIECGGLTVKDHKRLTSVKQYYKCIPCCVSASCCIKDILYETGVKNPVPVPPEPVDNVDNPVLTREDGNSSVVDLVKSGNSANEDNIPVGSVGYCSASQFEDTPLSVSQDSNTDRILIVDGINNPGQFSSSKRILHELNLYCPEVKVEFAYSLAKGGVAIHTYNTQDRDILLNKLPSESFGGGIKHLPKSTKVDTVFIKGVCTSIAVEHLKTYFSTRNIGVLDIRRLVNKTTGRPIQVVKVRCTKDSVSLLLSTKVVINNISCIVERQRSFRVIRCFKCQALGHVSSHCKNIGRCQLCAGTHESEVQCTGPVLCANCGGGHPAHSSRCPVYIQHHADLAKQYPKCFYVATTASSDGAQNGH